jgi:uncharacterized protein (TIGR03435 family)
MPDVSDMELLQDYARHGSEVAFAELVRRHVNLVYSAALRHVGIAAHAEEITQAVFIILAQKATRLRPDTILEAWFYQTARLTSLSFLRGERRRQWREQEAFMQSALQESDEPPIWNQLAPLLDEAMARLGQADREAIVLRFFKGKSLNEVAAALKVTDAAAQSRVHRAVEKLQKYFRQRGIDSTTAALTAMISAHSVHAAPLTLAKAATAVALAQGLTAPTSTLTLAKGALKIMAWTKTKTAIVAGVAIILIAGTSTTAVKKIEARKLDEWRYQNIQPYQVDQASPQVKILPTKFPAPNFTVESGTRFDKFVGIRVPVEVIAGKAYGVPRGRIRFAAEQPRDLYDFAATLPQGSQEALRRELKKKLGFVGRFETTNMEAMVLTLKSPNASGLKPPVSGKPDDYWNPGHFECFDQPIYTDEPPFQGLARFLEAYLGMPVVDRTGLTQHFSIDLTWKELGERDPNHNALKQALSEQLGLELASRREPIDILVVEKTQ